MKNVSCQRRLRWTFLLMGSKYSQQKDCIRIFDFILPINKRKLPYNYLQIKNGCPNGSERTRTSLGLRAGPGSQSPPPSASSMVGWGQQGQSQTMGSWVPPWGRVGWGLNRSGRGGSVVELETVSCKLVRAETSGPGELREIPGSGAMGGIRRA